MTKISEFAHKLGLAKQRTKKSEVKSPEELMSKVYDIITARKGFIHPDVFMKLGLTTIWEELDRALEEAETMNKEIEKSKGKK